MRNAGGMDLGETGIGEERAFFISAIRRGDVAAARVRGEIKNISVTAGGENDRVRGDVVTLTGAQLTGDDSLGMSIHNNDVEHFVLRKHLHRAGGDSPPKRLMTPKPKLLAALPARRE